MDSSVGSRVALKVGSLALFVYWLHALLSETPPWIFLDYANLIFHEAGHIIFMPFGEFMHVLGGSLTQLLVPLICFITFYAQEERDPLALAFSLFWLGDSAINLSFYIADASTMALPLLGGDTSGHDWNWLLSSTNALPYDTLFGRLVMDLGALGCIIAILLLGYDIYQDVTAARPYRQ